MRIPPPSPTSAFSLVEVALSMAIVAVAFLSLFALLPVGLQIFRSAIDSTVRTQISQQLITRAHQTEFGNLDQMASATATAPMYYYFNDEAVELPASRKSASLYTAAVSYEATTTLPAAAGTARLATLRLDIYGNKGIFQSGAPVDPQPARYTVHLADFGQRL